MINQITGSKRKQTIDDTIAKAFGSNDLVSLCNLFNDSFARRVAELRKMIRYQGGGADDYDTTLNSAYLPQMTEIDLEMVIKKMSVSKPAGNDNIRFRDILFNFHKLKDVLLKVINSSFSTGKIPAGLKTAVIRPLYKHGNRKYVTNYRPISILPVIAQIMEKWVHNTMTVYCEKYDLILWALARRAVAKYCASGGGAGLRLDKAPGAGVRGV